MKKQIAAMMFTTLALSGCDTKWNPKNWGGEKPKELQDWEKPREITDNRGLIDQVTSLKIERNRGGVIVNATGLPPTQGYWGAGLVAQNDGQPVNGVLSYAFRVQKPQRAQNISTNQSRQVVVGHYISNHKLRGVRQIRVIGANNARTAQR